LKPKDIETKVCNIGVEKATDRDSPELKAVPQFWEELILQLVQRAIPCVIILGFGIVEDEQYDEKHEQKQ
jgi:hypothetical protein